MLLRLEIRRHAALAGDAAAERYADELAFEIVGPLVIGADEFLRRAAELTAELGGAVLAAISTTLIEPSSARATTIGVGHSSG